MDSTIEIRCQECGAPIERLQSNSIKKLADIVGIWATEEEIEGQVKCSNCRLLWIYAKQAAKEDCEKC